MKILNFAPFAQISQHDGPGRLVARALIEHGASVVTVRCNSLLAPGCLAIQSASRSDQIQRKKVCDECRLKAGFADQRDRAKTIQLEAFITQEDRQEVDREVAQIARLAFWERLFREAPVAQFTCYEFSINNKLHDLGAMSHAQWDLYLEAYRTNLLVACAMTRILDHEKPDRLVTYNSRYGSNRVACWLAEQRGLPHFSMHAGAHLEFRLRQLTIKRGILEWPSYFESPNWSSERAIPISVTEAWSLHRHVRAMTTAKSWWTYSVRGGAKSADEVNLSLGLMPGQRFAVALMRSEDESLASKFASSDEFHQDPQLFPTQSDWLQFLFAYYKERPDKILVVRPHPRGFPNKREGKLAESSRRLRELASNLPLKNVIFNFPDDNIALHDLYKSASLVLNSSSSSGLEAVLQGKPVVGNGDWLPSYPPELQQNPSSLADYRLLLDEAQSVKLNVPAVFVALRYLNFTTRRFPIDISRGFTWGPVMQHAQKMARDLRDYAEHPEAKPLLRRIARSVCVVLFYFLMGGRKRLGQKLSRRLSEKILELPAARNRSARIEQWRGGAVEKAVVYWIVLRMMKRIGTRRDRATAAQSQELLDAIRQWPGS